MNEYDAELIAGRIRAALETQRTTDAIFILYELHPADRAEVFNLLDDQQQEILLALLDIPATADLLEELEDVDALEAIEDFSPEKLADVLDEMAPDEAADLLGDLPPEQVSVTLAQMEDADEVIPLLGYPDETAGGLMTTSYIALRRHTTAEQAIDFLRKAELSAEIPYYLYVVDRDRRLTGVVGLRELVVAQADTTMETIMDREVVYVTVATDQEEVARVISRYDLASVPVVDESGRLIGVITHDDIVDVLEVETTEDILHLGGVEAGPLVDKPYWTQRMVDVVRSRFFWLLLLFIAETFTGTVLRHFEDELDVVVALSFFIPLLIGTGGNAGSQTVATIIRALALREVRPRDFLKVWWREVRTGLFLGLLIALVAFGRALLWGVEQELAITVAITIAAIVIWANTVASVVPIIASRLGIDPTILSGPLMTTLIDGTGLLIYFSLAALILPQL
jgi:magnesium transporter